MGLSGDPGHGPGVRTHKPIYREGLRIRMVGPVRLNSNTKAAAYGWDVCGVRLKGFGALPLNRPFLFWN